MRVCPECGQLKEEFSFDRRAPNGRCDSCKSARRARREQGLWICARCRIEKSIIDFKLDKGRVNYCRACRAELTTLYSASLSKEVRREQQRRRTRRYQLRQYGLPQADYEEMVQKQKGQCAICRAQSSLQIDHDHRTGVVRELLCWRCNILIGHLENHPSTQVVAIQAIKYLEEHK